MLDWLFFCILSLKYFMNAYPDLGLTDFCPYTFVLIDIFDDKSEILNLSSKRINLGLEFHFCPSNL